MNSMLDTMAKPPSYHCIVLTLSAIDQQIDVPNVDTSAVYTERRKATESRFMVHDVFVFLCVKNNEREERKVRAHVVYLRLK